MSRSDSLLAPLLEASGFDSAATARTAGDIFLEGRVLGEFDARRSDGNGEREGSVNSGGNGDDDKSIQDGNGNTNTPSSPSTPQSAVTLISELGITAFVIVDNPINPTYLFRTETGYKITGAKWVEVTDTGASTIMSLPVAESASLWTVTVPIDSAVDHTGGEMFVVVDYTERSGSELGRARSFASTLFTVLKRGSTDADVIVAEANLNSKSYKDGGETVEGQSAWSSTRNSSGPSPSGTSGNGGVTTDVAGGTAAPTIESGRSASPHGRRRDFPTPPLDTTSSLHGAPHDFLQDKEAQAHVADSPHSDDAPGHSLRNSAVVYADPVAPSSSSAAAAAGPAAEARRPEVPTAVAHLVEDGMTADEIRRLEEEERALDQAIEQAAKRK
ncbi:unnamed protein product [Parascedosporium putredinis]|uniref:Uncharacterized protein n=1 Tax=Parascedosporium putredinis TaxID=1442378 RepID=A0A9P1H7L8_9PEZI|nr:unnamed protein product [Parascedosporium putredinis]CAI7998612.1 unnamed protein product [Parascedosporium putredinis]